MLKFSSRIFQYEEGMLEEWEVFTLFQELIDAGMVPHLQGSHQVMAQHLIEQGVCTPKAYPPHEKILTPGC